MTRIRPKSYCVLICVSCHRSFSYTNMKTNKICCRSKTSLVECVCSLREQFACLLFMIDPWWCHMFWSESRKHSKQSLKPGCISLEQISLRPLPFVHVTGLISAMQQQQQWRLSFVFKGQGSFKLCCAHLVNVSAVSLSGPSWCE